MILINIKENLTLVRKDLDLAKLIVVTKKRSNEDVASLIEFGVSDIGENKVQELIKRKEIFGDKLNYHMIGRLQSNKVKYLSGWVKLIHSLDSIKLARELDKIGERDSYTFECLIQLNISKEESKTGVYLEDLEEFINNLKEYKNIRIKGFMTMAPYDASEIEITNIFSQAKKTFEIYKDLRYNNLSIDILSMGMSNDYKIALKNGSNMIRVGSKIFE